MLTPPNDTELEKIALGAILLDFNALKRVEGILTPEKFFDPRNGLIFDSILKLKSENLPIDILTVTQTLRKSKQLSAAGGPIYLSELTTRVSSTANLETWALQMVENDPFDLYNSYSIQLTDLIKSNLKGETSHISQITPETTQSIEERERHGLSGIPTGISNVDHILGGHQKGDLVYIAARPGMGKTALALSVALNMAQSGYPVAFFSLEMSRAQLVFRLASILSGMNAEKLSKYTLTPEEKRTYYQTVDRLNALPIYIDDRPGLSILDLKTRVRTLAERSNVKAAFIDYVQLLSAGNKKNFGSREQEISTISRGLKLIAKENGIPVIALSQLSRAVEARQDKRPLLSDLRDSGSLEQDADVVAFLYRAGYYDTNAPINGAEFIIAKHRNGRTGMLGVNFTPETMHYTSQLNTPNNDIFEL